MLTRAGSITSNSYEKAALFRAARALFQSAAGAPAKDDRAALAEAYELLSRGVVSTPHAARMRVARRLAKHSQISAETICERLRRKWEPPENVPRNYSVGTSAAASGAGHIEKDAAA